MKSKLTKFAAILFAAALFLVFVAPAIAFSKPVVGEAAPTFTATTSKGEQVSLESLKGKIVVLEWTNDSCPFVKKHYDTNNMQTLQKETTGKGIVWAQVISSAPGKQGNVDGATADKLNADRTAAPTYTFLDASGALGRLYGAQTTPHMFVVAADGKLAYAGAIDDKSSVDKEDVKTANNYVRAAVDALQAGTPVAVTSTKSYGCGVKYAD